VSVRAFCPLCSCGKAKSAFPYETIWAEKKYAYKKCSSCGTTYISPLPSGEELEKIYSFESYHNVFYHEPAAEKYKKSVKTLMQYAGERKTLLDFGCGAGFFLDEAQKSGFICSGTELDCQTREKARAFCKADIFSFEEMRESDQKFDIIHMGDVLEHLGDPHKTTEALKAFLEPGGIFFFEGPLQNNPSVVYYFVLALKNIKRFFKIDKPAKIPPTHLILTNKNAMTNFFSKRLGLKIKYFRVYETGWPYLSRRPKKPTPGWYLKAIAGGLAVLLSLLEPGNNKKLGNRFMAICAE